MADEYVNELQTGVLQTRSTQPIPVGHVPQFALRGTPQLSLAVTTSQVLPSRAQNSASASEMQRASAPPSGAAESPIAASAEFASALPPSARLPSDVMLSAAAPSLGRASVTELSVPGASLETSVGGPSER